jgi:hypothetical protein
MTGDRLVHRLAIVSTIRYHRRDLALDLEGGCAKRFNSDLRKVRKLMRRGENGDISFFEEGPTADPFWHIVEITNQGDVDFALQEKLDKAVLWLLAKLDVKAGNEFSDLGDRIKNGREAEMDGARPNASGAISFC